MDALLFSQSIKETLNIINNIQTKLNSEENLAYTATQNCFIYSPWLTYKKNTNKFEELLL